MICLRVGSTRPQKGHWKSDHSTIVTGAFFGPRTGALPTLTSYFWSGDGAAATAGAEPADFTFSATSVSYSLSCFTPFLSAASAFLIWSSMTVLKVSNGIAPEMNRPLMKNDGVPSAPTDWP